MAVAGRIRLRAVVGDIQEGFRADRVAAVLFSDYSRTRLQAWMRSGELLLDGDYVAPRDAMHSGQILELDAEPQEATCWEPERMELELLHSDADLLVVNKPPGLVVHPGAGVCSNTLANGLLGAFPELQAVPRAGIVHRLDRDTSGLMLVARTLSAHTWLVQLLQQRRIERFYQALVVGRMGASGTVDAPIGRHPIWRTRMAVRSSGGRPAVTHYRVHQRFAGYTHLALKLETGRTHQIRVHCAHIGHPVVGDRSYGRQPSLGVQLPEPVRQLLRQFPRQALHAQRLCLPNLHAGRELMFEAPAPADYLELVAGLERAAQR